MSQKNSKNNAWQKADVIIKGMAAILVTGAITFYGIYSEKKQFSIAEKNRKSQIVVQTMGNRESAAADMRAKMFDTLMQYYFKEKEDQITQVKILELIGLNFQDHLHLKPLFEKLDAELPGDSQEKKELRKAAKNIINNEIAKIVGSGGRVCELELVVNQEVNVECAGPLRVKLQDVKDDYIMVSLGSSKNNGFNVTYFDMPLVDNTRMGELTYSIILSNIEKKDKKAKIKVVILPQHYYSARNSLLFDAMIGDFLYEDY
jgi:hypothetical protein